MPKPLAQKHIVRTILMLPHAEVQKLIARIIPMLLHAQVQRHIVPCLVRGLLTATRHQHHRPLTERTSVLCLKIQRRRNDLPHFASALHIKMRVGLVFLFSRRSLGFRVCLFFQHFERIRRRLDIEGSDHAFRFCHARITGWRFINETEDSSPHPGRSFHCQSKKGLSRSKLRHKWGRVQ